MNELLLCVSGFFDIRLLQLLRTMILCGGILCVHISVFLMAIPFNSLGKVPAPIPATVTAGAPTAARVLLKQRSEDPSIGRSSASTGLATGSPTSPSEDNSVVGRGAGTAGGEADDDHSDKGTYTIELENRNPEEEEARRMIDKVRGRSYTKRSVVDLVLAQPPGSFVLQQRLNSREKKERKI